MSEISEAAKAKACEWASASLNGGGNYLPSDIGQPHLSGRLLEPFARYIQQVSDVVSAVMGVGLTYEQHKMLAPFTLPDPVAPDPLEVVLKEAGMFGDPVRTAKLIHDDLAKLGFEVREQQS